MRPLQPQQEVCAARSARTFAREDHGLASELRIVAQLVELGFKRPGVLWRLGEKVVEEVEETTLQARESVNGVGQHLTSKRARKRAREGEMVARRAQDKAKEWRGEGVVR